MPALVAAAALLSVATAPPNILFVVYDDLRPQLASYGHDRMSTPHFDSLANESLVFNRAYTNYPYCAPSRNSFMSGRMPDHAHDWNFLDSFRQKDVHSNPSPNIGATWVALPEFFKNHGWWTVGSGKLYHPNLPVDNDNPRSWSENLTDYGGNSGCTCPSTPSAAHPHAPMFCALPENTSCPDVVITDTVVQQLQHTEPQIQTLLRRVWYTQATFAMGRTGLVLRAVRASGEHSSGQAQELPTRGASCRVSLLPLGGLSCAARQQRVDELLTQRGGGACELHSRWHCHCRHPCAASPTWVYGGRKLCR